MSPKASESEEDVMWSKRPEWQDVEPVPQDDAPNALVPIAYHEYCKSSRRFLMHSALFSC
jgi:hypothetical protein